MTAVEIATGIIDKLQEENRKLLDALHSAHDKQKYSDRQLAEKDRIIKVLEERIRAGTDGILEMTNRQKDLTIKHLEMQIQKLLKENEDYEVRLDAVKAEICAKCETKLLLREHAGSLKSYKPPGKSSSIQPETTSSQICYPKRVKELQRIIEHKDKRILNLTNQIKTLNKSEKELNDKLYRYSKLLPLARLPSETIIDCLLKEIKLLESQNKNNDGFSKPSIIDVPSKPSASYTSSTKTNFSKSTEKFKPPVFAKHKTSRLNLPESDPLDATKFENEVLHKNLQQLSNYITEIKRLFAFEGENLSHVLNSTANEYRTFKIKLKEILNNLNEIVQNVLGGDFRWEEKDLEYQSDDKYVIDRLQERLKEYLNIVTEYENENKTLKEKLETLKIQMTQKDNLPDYFKKSSERLFKSFSDSNINDVQKLHEIIKDKESQLEAAKSYISKREEFIEELQNKLKHSSFHHPKIQHFPDIADNKAATRALEQEIKLLQAQINVYEKNLKTCESVIEKLQSEKKDTEDRNVRLECELHEYKSKTLSQQIDKNNRGFSELSETNALKKLNQELQDKIKTLEATIEKLQTDLNSGKTQNVASETKTLEATIKKLQVDLNSEKTKNVALEALAQEKILLQSQLDAANKQINTLEKGVETLQEKLKIAEAEKIRFETELKEMIQRETIAEAYENDVMALKNQLILKEDENQELKEKFRNLEIKNAEMNEHKKTLYQEIEKLSKILTEDEQGEDSERRKALYKAALLRSAQALLRLDDNFNLKTDDSDSSSNAFDELTHQTKVYLTEVARIHSLVISKDRQRQEMFREYFDDETALKLSSPRLFESHTQGQPSDDDLQSAPNLNRIKSPAFPQNEKASKTASDENCRFKLAETVTKLKQVEEELAATKSVTTYLLTSCTRLEDLLSQEKTERAKYEKELEVCQEVIKDLKVKLNSKDSVTKRLNQLVEWMRSKEYNDEMALDKLRNEMQWLAEKATTTETELHQCREENSKMKTELSSLKRELIDEKYEKAKTASELKRLRMEILNSQTISDETHTSE